MSENTHPIRCPECAELVAPVDRRDFLRTATAAALSASALTVPATARAADPAPARREERPAETLVRELFSTLTNEQKRDVVLAWDHGSGNNRIPTRLGMYNAPILNKRIGQVYTQAQQELVQRTLRAICSTDDGYTKISRNNTFDGSGSLGACGALFFGEPREGERFAWVFSGHHLTVRCDGRSEEGAAFGGPMYYGHSPNGYSPNNVFNYQTRSVVAVYDMLNAQQRQRAELNGSPGEHAESVRFRRQGEAHPGLAVADLTADQKRLVESVMRDVLSPYRREDADLAMQVVQKNGGMDRIHLAFYRDNGMNDNMRWHFWRLEGPGFVWNYRVLPHVHTYVNISTRV